MDGRIFLLVIIILIIQVHMSGKSYIKMRKQEKLIEHIVRIMQNMVVQNLLFTI